MSFSQGGGGSFNLLNAIAAELEKEILRQKPQDDGLSRRVGKALAFPPKKHRTPTPNPSPLERGKAAFTLAEVLITLGIIGVVAAMTLPTLVAKYKEKQRVTQVKKAYSVLNQAFNMAKLEYGDVIDWGLTTTSTGQTDENGEPVYDYTGPEIVKRNLGKYLKQAKGKQQHTFRQILSLDGRNYNASGSSTISDKSIALYLEDGTLVIFGWMYFNCTNSVSGCGDIRVILPESTAQLGVTDFWFYLSPKGIQPYGHQNHSRPFESFCDIKNSSGQAATAQGRGCTAWVIYNENMDYLHCNDLSWDGKKKCK